MKAPAMRGWRWRVGLSLCGVGLLLPWGWSCEHLPATAAARVSFQDLEESLTCQCGCGLTVHSCNHLQCSSAVPLRKEIRAQMRLGKTKDQILAYFSGKYGEKILSSPSTSGFNLVAWVLPFVLLGLGGMVVGFTVVRWSGRPPPASGGPPQTPGPAQAPSASSRILERELKNFDA